MGKKIRHIRSKTLKTMALAKHPILKRHIPVTKVLRKQNLKRMLNKYKMVYIKPDRGRFGQGIMKVEKFPRGKKIHYRCQMGTKANIYHCYDSLYRFIIKKTARRDYIIQRGIHMLTYKGRPFDLRVMVQLTSRRKWAVTGMISRVAQHNRIVTNFHNRGLPLSLATTLRPYFHSNTYRIYLKKMRKLGLQAAKQTAREFTHIKEVGIDIAIDQNMKMWILEVNTLPDPFIFKQLRNKRTFRRIYAYAVKYGKYSA